MTYITGTAQTETRHIDFTAGLIQMTLATKGVQSIVAPLWDGPQLQSYEVSLTLGTKPEKVLRLTGAVAMAAGVDAVRIGLHCGKLLIEIPKPLEARQTLPARKLLDLEPATSWHVPLGLGATGRTVWLNLADERYCHVALGGTTRSGKTNLLHWLLSRLLVQNGAHDLQLLLCDPKGYELEPFAMSRHLVHPPVYNTREIVQVLAWLHQTTRERAHSGVSRPRILAVIDEVKELVDRCSEVKGILASLAQIGAGVGVSIVVTTQQPGSKALGDALPNFPCRILGRVVSKTLSYGAAGRARSQAECLLGRGDMLLLGPDGMIRLQTPLVTRSELRAIPRWERASQIPKLDLPTAVSIPVDTDPRGGWNRKAIDQDAVRLAVQMGATATDLHHELGINYDRACRLYEQYGGEP